MSTEKPKFSRYTTTEYNRSERVLRTLRDIYSSAQSFHSDHDWILAELSRRIYSTRDYQKLTSYYRGLFEGTRRALMDSLWRYALEWRVDLDGVLVRSEDVPQGAWNRVRDGAHVWKDAPERIFSDARKPKEVKADAIP